MSKTGAPRLAVDAGGARIVIVASQWHETVMDGLIAGAMRALETARVADVSVVRVPGSFELPVVAQAHAEAGADAVVALGVIIRGQTPHFDYIASATTDALMRVSTDTRVPVGFGVLTCEDDSQARDRAGLPGSREDKGREAAEAALFVLQTLGAVNRPSDAHD